MLRNLIRLAVLLLIANALYRFVPPYVHYHQFKDAVADVLLFAKDRSDSEITDQVTLLAEKYKIPIQRETVQVTHEGQLTRIEISYEEPIEWVPAFKRPMGFTVSVEGFRGIPPPPGIDPFRK